MLFVEYILSDACIGIPVDDLSRCVRAMVNNLPGDLMANNTRTREREFTFQNMEIRVANSASCIS